MVFGSFKYVATTPRAISSAIYDFCSQLCGEAPCYVTVTPDPFAQVGKCYLNAEMAVERHGGEALYGWIVWEMPGVYLTAEHHAVVGVDGSLLDVTPQFNGERRVLFVPDGSTRDLDQRPLNKYVPLSDDPRIARFVQLMRRNAFLERDCDFGEEFFCNDATASRLLDSYLARLNRRNGRRQQNAQRKLKKAERQRRKCNRR